MLLFLVATNASGVLLILTRFTLELFSVLLSIVFVGFIVVKFWDIHHDYAHSNYFLYPITERTCDCYRAVNSTQWELVVGGNCTEDDDFEFKWIGSGCPSNQRPDVFFLSIILLLGTFLVAMYLKKFYHTPFLTLLVSQNDSILII